MLHAAKALVMAPSGSRLEALQGALQGRHSIRVNDLFRVTFRFQDGGAWEVRCEDYH